MAKKLLKGLLILLGIFVAGVIIILAIPDSWVETKEEPSPTEAVSKVDTNKTPDTDTGKGDKTSSGTASADNTEGLSALPEHALKAKTDYSSAKTVTILCYMNGSDLETEYQEATTDLSEIIDAPYSDNVHVVVQTMGTKKWSKKYGVDSDHTQRFLVKENGLELVDDSLGQLDCTRSSTLSDFITWGVKKYPADRYILMFWDHGGGPVYGFGYDEYQSYDDSMSIDEMQLALATAGVTFDFIGMDCCIMSCMEVCCAMYGYCDYMILSEDFEPGLGWSYEGWMTAIAQNPAIDTLELGKIICDDCIKANETDVYGDECILSVLDQSVMRVLFTAWTDFAYANEEALLGENYSRPITKKANGRTHPRFSFDTEPEYDLSDYFITDIMAVAQNIDSDEAAALESAVNNVIVYSAATEGDEYLTGLAVTLPYSDTEFYSSLKSIFTNCGFDEEYISWLSKFTSVKGDSYYDFSDWDSMWGGWDDYEDDYDWYDWDYYDEYDYWDYDDSESWWNWDYSDYWEDDWYCYDDYDYHYDGYCSDDYWSEYGYYYDDYWDQGGYDDYGWDDWSGWGYDYDGYDSYRNDDYGYDDYGYDDYDLYDFFDWLLSDY